MGRGRKFNRPDLEARRIHDVANHPTPSPQTPRDRRQEQNQFADHAPDAKASAPHPSTRARHRIGQASALDGDATVPALAPQKARARRFDVERGLATVQQARRPSTKGLEHTKAEIFLSGLWDFRNLHAQSEDRPTCLRLQIFHLAARAEDRHFSASRRWRGAVRQRRVRIRSCWRLLPRKLSRSPGTRSGRRRSVSPWLPGESVSGDQQIHVSLGSLAKPLGAGLHESDGVCTLLEAWFPEWHSPLDNSR